MSGTLFTILTIAYTLFGIFFYEWRVMTYIDEAYAMLFAGYALVQIFFHKIPKYRPLIIWLGIALFYLAYSFLIHSNVPIAIFNDFVMQTKPYMMFFALMALRPRLERIHCEFLAFFSTLCFPIMCVIYAIYPHWREGTYPGELLTGAAFSSVALLIGALFYFSCQKDSRITRCIAIILMAIGTLAPTSKFWGTLFMSIIIIFFVKKPIKINIKFLIASAIILLCIAIIVWEDFVFYFVTDSDLNARPVLYTTAPHILNDYIPFGSGYATFANAASATWYSPIYSQYDIDNIWGLVEGEALFVADTYYPTLAQFGYVGVVLFILFFVYIFRLANKLYAEHKDLKRYRTTLIIVAYILIEATSSSFTNERCILAMILLALSLYKHKPIVKRDIEDTLMLRHLKISH